MNLPSMRGISLTEALAVVATLAVLATIAVPEFTSTLQARRISGATENIRIFLQFARSESIKQMRPMVATFAMSGSTNWRIGIRDDDECNLDETDPEAPNACSIPSTGGRILTVLDGANFIGTLARANRSATRFDPIHGTAAGSNATIMLSNSYGHAAYAIIANSGRVRTCSPAGKERIGDFPVC